MLVEEFKQIKYEKEENGILTVTLNWPVKKILIYHSFEKLTEIFKKKKNILIPLFRGTSIR